MASFIDLLNPSFLMFLGILVLVAALLVVYLESKMREQNHKISSMVSLVSAMAEELGVVKSNLNLVFLGGSRADQQTEEKTDLKQVIPNNNKLIAVSDDEDEDEDECECEDDDNESGNNSDDELEKESDGESDSNEDRESDLDSDSDSESEIEFEEDNIIDLDDKPDVSQVKILNISINELDNKDETLKIHVVNEELEEMSESFSDNQNKINSFDLKTINISSIDIDINNVSHANEQNDPNEINETNEPVDYKKMPTQKLKSIVVEKGLSNDASKLKKHELLKLLGIGAE